ncbi:MAG: multidrug efflux RND transporter permease subunit [Alphaproteobacteria bacterium]|jgi:multidrug efflux pump|nr:multidrug efflux RND transporter permease subunit [Alphaproteobacteria bacterium]
MSLSKPFIDRPIGTTLLAIGFALAGILAFNVLPVAPLPQVDFPTISVQASLPGASPEIMATSVATPLERQLSRIAGITEMTSSSNLGSASITLQFDLNRNIDGAAREVQAAIAAARSQLPTDLPSNPTYRKINPADAPVMIVSLTSDVYTKGQMFDLASTVLQQKLSQVDGVGQVTVGGGSLPAVRVELNPDALAKYGIPFERVRTVLATANANKPKGFITHGDLSYDITSSDQLFKAKEYAPLLIGYHNGNAIKLQDVAEVKDAVEDVRNAGLADGKPSILLIIFKEPTANILETVTNVHKILPELSAITPAAINVGILMDRTTTIRASLHDVEVTLIIAIILVILVIYAFLGNARATLIPAVTVPLSLLGTFGIMYFLGYSLNNFSLMALTIATGFVVDDAVVVLENIERHIEKGMPPLAAALLGAKEVGFTVVSMSLSLVAVFIPILLMGGIVGRLFREFAVTLSSAVLVSMVVSLTVTPMMGAVILRAKDTPKDAHSARFMTGLTRFYKRSLLWALSHQRIMLFLMFATLALSVFLFILVPKGFFPQQDTGRIVATIQAQQNISFQAMEKKLSTFVDIVRKDPAVAHVAGYVGGRGTGNSGVLFIMLRPLSKRKASVDDIINRLRPQLAVVPGATLYLRAAQDIMVGGRQGNAQYQYTLSAYHLRDLQKYTPRVLEHLKKIPGIADMNSDQLDKGLQAYVTLDRENAARFGLTATSMDNGLYDAFGQRQVSTMYTTQNQYRVVMEAAPPYGQRPHNLNDLYLPSSTNTQVPLATLATFENKNALLTVAHQSQLPAATLSFNLLPTFSLGQAVDAIDEEMKKLNIPVSVLMASFQGTAQAFQASLSSQPYLILAALVAVYVVLGMLYESTVHPITILSTLPSAGVGALLALYVTRTELSIIALIGILLLVGIVKKNAIMMIDFALEAERTHHKSPPNAIYEACLLRFRPIMMTTMAALLSAVPLAVGFGEGSEFRRPLGITIIGGLILSQMLTLYTTPVIYLKFSGAARGFEGLTKRLFKRKKTPIPVS